MAHMKEDLHLRFTAYDTGIFHVQGGIFPIQVLITGELSKRITTGFNILEKI